MSNFGFLVQRSIRLASRISKRRKGQPGQTASLTNIFLSYVGSNQEFAEKLVSELGANKIDVWKKQRGTTREEIKSRIEAAEYFACIISPDYVSDARSRRELSCAIDLKKHVVPILREAIDPQVLSAVLPPHTYAAIHFRPQDEFKKSFSTLLSRLSPDFHLDAFISYSRHDLHFVKNLIEHLQSNSKRVWLDKKNINYSDKWRDAIHSAIEAADNFVFVLSPDSVSSDYCQDELQYASAISKRLIPILFREVRELPLPLSEIQGINFSSDEGFDTFFQKLLTTLSIDLEYVRQHTKLLLRSGDWVRKRREKSLLLRGAERSEARRWLSDSIDKNPRPTNTQIQFINASNVAHRKRVVSVLVISCVIILTAVFTARSLLYLRKATLARSLLAASLALRTESSDISQRSLLLALESYRRNPSPETYKAISDGILARPKVVYRILHNKPVTGICFSNDGRYLVTASLDGSLNTSDARTGTVFWHHSFEDRVTDIACSADNKTLAVGLRNSFELRDITTGALLKQVTSIWRPDLSTPIQSGDQDLRSLFFSPSGRYLVALSGGDVLLLSAWQEHVWDVTENREVSLFTAQLGVKNKVQFTSDDQYFVTSPRVGPLTVIRCAKNEVVQTIQPAGDVTDYAISSNGSYLAAANQDGLLTIWDLRSRQIVHTIQHDSSIDHVVFDPKERYLATGTQNHYVHVWDINDWHEVSRFKHAASTVDMLIFSPNGDYLISSASAANDPTVAVIVWRTNDGSEIARLTNEAITQLSTEQNGPDFYKFYASIIRKVIVSPDSHLIASTGNDGVVTVWTPDADKLQLPGNPCFVEKYCEGLSTNGQFVAAVDKHQKQLVLKATDGGRPAQLISVPEKTSVDFVSNDGETVGTHTIILHTVSAVELHSELILVLWQVSRQEPILVRKFRAEEFVPIYAVSPNGKYVIETRADGTAAIDVASSKVAWKDGPSASTAKVDATSLSFDRSGQYFINWDNQKRIAEVRETATSARLYTMKLKQTISGAAVDMLGGHIALVEKQKATVTQIDGTELGSITASDAIRWIVFSPRGDYLAVATWDNTVQVWALQTLIEVARLRLDDLGAVTFDSQGDLIFIVRDRVTRTHWLPEHLLDEGCSRLTRNLSPEEWKEYVGSERYHRTCETIP